LSVESADARRWNAGSSETLNSAPPFTWGDSNWCF